jgi:hypothetical protein
MLLVVSPPPPVGHPPCHHPQMMTPPTPRSALAPHEPPAPRGPPAPREHAAGSLRQLTPRESTVAPGRATPQGSALVAAKMSLCPANKNITYIK